MKKIIHITSSILLSVVVLVSSMSFVVEEHYCGETLIDTSYFGNAESCGMNMTSSSPKNSEITKPNCCKDKTVVVESSVFNKEKVVSVPFSKVRFLYSYLYSYIEINQSISLEKQYYKDFSPPDTEQNLQILHQTFLI